METRKQRIRNVQLRFFSLKNFSMARVSSYLVPDRQSDYTLLAFPEKLWWIVNNPKRDEIHWNAQGTCLVIPNTQRFISEVLNNKSNGLFKTKHCELCPSIELVRVPKSHRIWKTGDIISVFAVFKMRI